MVFQYSQLCRIPQATVPERLPEETNRLLSPVRWTGRGVPCLFCLLPSPCVEIPAKHRYADLNALVVQLFRQFGKLEAVHAHPLQCRGQGKDGFPDSQTSIPCHEHLKKVHVRRLFIQVHHRENDIFRSHKTVRKASLASILRLLAAAVCTRRDRYPSPADAGPHHGVLWHP